MISAVVLAKNEEKNIAACLEGLSWCDEILVIDDGSTDKTAEIAAGIGARVLYHKLHNFSDQRNFALEKANNEWVLFIDADERITDGLQNEIKIAIRSEDKNGYFTKRVDVLWGRRLRHGEVGGMRLLRLGRKTKGKWLGEVHEVWEVSPPVGVLTESLVHFPHPTIAEFLSKINIYSTIRAKELKEQGVRASVLGIIFYPKAKFFLNYIIKLGFLDGVPGVLSATMMSLHSFLVRGKLWLLWQRKSD